ncbi:MAG: hypothetical protein MZV64_27775 [Ignavibacteriales bacterium]|nr:hypothetical protein [Ignavibacteriales bacterium]
MAENLLENIKQSSDKASDDLSAQSVSRICEASSNISQDIKEVTEKSRELNEEAEHFCNDASKGNGQL